MYKNYKYKLNMLEPGSKILKLLGILLVGGLLTHIIQQYTVRNILLVIVGIMLATLLILVVVELHQDKVLNEQAMRLDSKIEAGIKKKSFSLHYNKGEIWCEHLDSLGDHKKIVMNKFNEDLLELKKVSAPSFIAVNLDETMVDRDILEMVLYSYRDLDKDLKKVVFIGLSRRNVRLMKKIIRESDKKITYITGCINDFEKAKE
nr:hypothetical protein [uncultured Anaerosporobacter sp.]